MECQAGRSEVKLNKHYPFVEKQLGKTRQHNPQILYSAYCLLLGSICRQPCGIKGPEQ